jgi:hypothetical protein
MKKIESGQLLDDLLADTRRIIAQATSLKTEDPADLLEQPVPGKWSVIQVLEHLNGYGRYYLTAIEEAIQSDKKAAPYFKPGWLGDYFTKLMAPKEGEVPNKMQSPKAYRPPATLDAFPVLNTFLEQQQYLLQLLEQARIKNLNSIRIPISISKIIRLKLGDTFRFLIAHEERHFIQVKNTLSHIRTKKRLTTQY